MSDTVPRALGVGNKETDSPLNIMEDAVVTARALEKSNLDLQAEIAHRRQLDEAHRRLSTVIEQAAESIIITDAQGVIEYVNPAFERITGFSKDEAVGRTPRILNSGLQDASFYEELWQTISGGAAWSGRFINRRKDGSLFEEEATITPVRDGDGVITNFAAIKRDVTAEVALQEQLRHAQKIEAIGTLAGGIAHDFNNLLQAMLSIVQVVIREHSRQPSRVAGHLEQLEGSIRRGAQLTRQLLLFARREGSRKEDADLNEVLRNLAPFLRRVVRENILLGIEPDPLPLWIHADRGQIEQVIMNLVLNAIDAMPAGGTLSIRAFASGSCASMEVRDTGTGIPEAVRDHIFEPFFTTKGVGKGTGLGLSVVHGIVTGHGGSITVESSPHAGTVFRVDLPVQRQIEAASASNAACADVSPGRGECVLVVEDEETARAGLVALLELFGYEVLAASSGEEALAIDESLEFSVVLTDMMLPGICGIDLVVGLRHQRPGLKAILMSGYAPPDTIERAVEEHELQFLQKPFDGTTLARVLESMLRPQPA